MTASLAAALDDPVNASRTSRGGDTDTLNGTISVRGDPIDWIGYYYRTRRLATTQAEAEAYVQDLLGELGLPAVTAFRSESPADGTWMLYWDAATPAGPLRAGSAEFSNSPTGQNRGNILLSVGFEALPPQTQAAINYTQAVEVAFAQADCLGYADRDDRDHPLKNLTFGWLKTGGEPDRLGYVVRVAWGEGTPAKGLFHGCDGPATYVTVDAITGALVDWRIDVPVACD